MSFLISDAMAAGPAASGQGDPLMSLLLPVGLVALFYFMLIRPQSKRAKEHKELVAGVQKGEEIVTGGGILGKVTSVDDNFVALEISPGVTIRIQKNAIQSIMPKGTIKELK